MITRETLMERGSCYRRGHRMDDSHPVPHKTFGALCDEYPKARVAVCTGHLVIGAHPGSDDVVEWSEFWYPVKDK